MLTITRVLALAALQLAMLIPASAQAPVGTVEGTVLGPGGNPMPGVSVVAEDTLIGAVTDGGGRYALSLPEGEYRLVFSSFGMTTAHKSAEVAPGESLAVDAQMAANTFFARQAAAFEKAAPEHLEQKAAYLASVADEARGTEGPLPDVVVIFFDDLGYGDLGSYGNRLIETPAIDQVAEEGLRLTEFYSSSPVCTPSRAGLLTGRYPSRALAANHVFFPTTHPVAALRKALGFQNALPRDEILLPEVMAEAGYRNAMVGKWHLGDEEGHRPLDFGFERFFGALYSNDMQPFALYEGDAVAVPPAEVDQRELTDRYTEAALEALGEEDERPLFLYIAHTFPHVPHFAAEDDNASAGGLYGDVVEDLDRSVGAVMDAVRASGRPTFVFITSDNGGDELASVGALRGRKGETYEGGMRVPGIAWFPGVIEAGSQSDAMAMNIDLFPTLAAIIGAPLPGDRVIDGADIGGVLFGGEESPHDTLLYTSAWDGNFVAIRDDQFKYRMSQPRPSVNPFHPAPTALYPVTAPSLYDLDRDAEAHDLSARHPEAVERLRRALMEARRAAEVNPRGWMQDER